MANKKIIRKSNRPFTYNPHYYSWGGDFLNTLKGEKGDGLSLKKTFSGANVGKMLKSGLATAAGNMIGSGASKLFSNGLESGAGNAINKVGSTLGGAVSTINPILGAGVTAATGIVSGLVNGTFGSKLNNEKIADIENSNKAIGNVIADSSSADAIESQWATQDFGSDFSKSDIGKDGLFSSKAKNKYKELKAQQDIARNRALAAFSDAATAVDTNTDLNAMANFAAFGGPLDMWGSNAIGYELSKEDLGTKALKAANESKLSSLPNSFTSPELNTFAYGGDFTNGQTIIGNGGTHEENPLEGVPMGIDAEGNPNLVEQGEVIFDDYVFSNRLFADGGLLDRFNLPEKYNNHSFAFIAEKLGEESKDRPNDPISKRGLMSSMIRLKQAQEMIREDKQSESTKGKKFLRGGPIDESLEDSFEAIGTDVPEYMARAAAKRAGYKVGDSVEGYMENPVKLKTKSSKDFNLTNLRYAPVVGSAIGLAQNLFSKPDYTNADAILEAANSAGNYTPVEYTPIGNYLTYKPFDRNYYLNKLNAQANASRRAIMNTSSPSRNAALLAADYNAQGRLGDLARQAEEYNLAQRQAVETFNRATNQANAEMRLKAAMANQQAQMSARNSKLSGIAQAMSVRNAIDDRRAASLSANMTNLFDSLGNIGIDAYNRADRDMLIRTGNFGTLSEKPQEWTTEQWNNYKELLKRTSEGSSKTNKSNSKTNNKRKKGGYLTHG